MRMIVSFAALFLSMLLLQLSSSAVGPLDALAGLQNGFSRGEVGFLGSMHFLGFFIGCWWAPRLMGDVGHSRAFAAFTAMGAIGMAGHVLVFDPTAWALLRIMSGICIAGCYTVIESWLQAKVTNASRGRAMGLYRVVDMGGSLIAQLMIGTLASMETYIGYNLLTILCCAVMLPLALTRVPQPETPSAPRLRPSLAWRMSPLAVAGVLVAASHAHDFATNEERMELSAALMFFYAVGAIAAPWGTSLLIEAFGPSALFYFISAGHVLLVIFGLQRMRVRDTREDRTPYVYAPPHIVYDRAATKANARQLVSRQPSRYTTPNRVLAGQHGTSPHHIGDSVYQRDQTPRQSDRQSTSR